MQKSIEKVMHLGIICCKDFDEFLKEKSKHVGTKIEQKSMPTSKSDFLKKPRFSLGKTMILRVQGFEVGGKNRSKIDEKMKSKREGVLGRICHRFWWVWEAKLGGKMEPRSMQKGIDKNDRKKKGGGSGLGGLGFIPSSIRGIHGCSARSAVGASEPVRAPHPRHGPSPHGLPGVP